MRERPISVDGFRPNAATASPRCEAGQSGRARRKASRARLVFLVVSSLIIAGCASTSGSSATTGVTLPAATTIAPTSPSTQAVHYYPVWVDFPAPGQAWGLFWEQYSAQGCAMAVAQQGSPGVFASPATFGHFACGNYMGVSEVAIDGRGDVFAYGPELFVSHDGGRTFARDLQPGAILAVSAVGPSIWMLEAHCPANAAQAVSMPCPLALFTSNDGGRTFAQDAHLPRAAVRAGDVSHGPGLRSNWLQRPSAGVGYVFVPPFFGSQAGASSPNAESVYRSADGGVSWTQSSIGGCANAFVAEGSVNPQGQVMVICSGQPAAGYQAKSVFVSPSGGTAWQPRFGCMKLGCSSVNSPLNSGYLGLVAFISPTTAFSGGGRSQLLVSRDGGVSWHPVPGVASNGGDTYSGAFFGSVGYIFGDEGSVSQGYIWTTTDAGVSWSRVPVEVVQ